MDYASSIHASCRDGLTYISDQHACMMRIQVGIMLIAMRRLKHMLVGIVEEGIERLRERDEAKS